MKTSTRQFVKYWMPVIAWMVLICLGSTDVLSAEHTSRFLVPLLRWLDPQISLVALIRIQFAVRKLGHFTEYAVLAAVLWRALRAGTTWPGKGWVLFAATLLGCAMFAASDEFHQSFVPSRTSSSHDVLIDICGAAVGVVLCWLVSRRKSVPVFASSGK